MISEQQLEALDPQVRQAMLSLMSEVATRDEQLRAKDALIERRERDVAFKQALIDKLTHEVAVLKRMKFAATSEKFAEAPAASEPGVPPVTYWSHSTPPALSTCSPTTLSSKVGVSAVAALLILPHTSLSALPNASAW